MSEDFSISVDRDRRIVTICGIRYTFELFEDLGWKIDPEQYFQIAERGDGAITIRVTSAPVPSNTSKDHQT